MSGSGKKEERSRLHSRLTRRQVIKAGGVAALGLAFSKPIVETLRPKPASANVSFIPGGSPGPSAGTPFTLTLAATQMARIARDTPDPNIPPVAPFADQALGSNILGVIRDFPDSLDPTDRIGRSVFYFDITPIVSGSNISSATLSMVCFLNVGNANSITVHNIVAPSLPAPYTGSFPSWDSSNVRWNNQLPPALPFGGTGGFLPSLDHDPSAEASGNSTPTGGSTPSINLTFDLTLLVQDWTTGARLNNGVLMKVANEATTELAIFCLPIGLPDVPRLIINGTVGGTIE